MSRLRKSDPSFDAALREAFLHMWFARLGSKIFSLLYPGCWPPFDGYGNELKEW